MRQPVSNMTREFTWAICSVCKREFRSRTAKVCQTCRDRLRQRKDYAKNTHTI